MVVLQHTVVIVQYSEVITGLYEEVVGPPWMVHVVHSSSYQGSKHLQLGEYVLDKPRG